MNMLGLTESAKDVPIVFDANLNDKGKMKGIYHLNMMNFMEF